MANRQALGEVRHGQGQSDADERGGHGRIDGRRPDGQGYRGFQDVVRRRRGHAQHWTVSAGLVPPVGGAILARNQRCRPIVVRNPCHVGRRRRQEQAEASLALDGFALASPALLHSDVVQLERLQAGCQASWQTDRIDIEKSSLDCDLGNASLAGTIPLGQKTGSR